MSTFIRSPRLHVSCAVVLLAALHGMDAGVERLMAAQQGGCNRPLPEPVSVFNVPAGFPIPTRDGCWLFTLSAAVPDLKNQDGLAAIRRTESGFELHRFLPITVPRPGGPNSPPVVGTALTHDETLLIVSHHQRLTFVDVGKLTGTGDPVLGYIESPRLSGSSGVTISNDDKYAFAAQWATSAVVIVDLEKIRKGVIDQSALAGLIPTPQGATTPIVSRDGRFLFTTTLRAPDVVASSPTCANKQGEGAIHIADVQRAQTSPLSATVGFAFPAGCTPMNLAISPDGTRLSAAAPGAVMQPALSAKDSAVVVFDPRPVGQNNQPTLIARIPVPSQVTKVVDTGDRLFVSFFFLRADNPGKSKHIMVLDTSKLAMGTAAILGTLPVASLEIAVSADRRLLFASQEANTKLTVIDLQRVKLEPPAN